jgi:hypothetical protein
MNCGYWRGDGEIDRSQLTTDYNAQLTDAAVQGMSKYLKDYDFDAPPTGAEILKTRVSGDQTFFVVRIAFPRGDTASLLMGLNAQGKITGIDLMSIAGD